MRLVSILTLFALFGEDVFVRASDGLHDGTTDTIEVTLYYPSTIPPLRYHAAAVYIPKGSFLIDALDKAQADGDLWYRYELDKYGAHIIEMASPGLHASIHHDYEAWDFQTGERITLGISCYQPYDRQVVIFDRKGHFNPRGE